MFFLFLICSISDITDIFKSKWINFQKIQSQKFGTRFGQSVAISANSNERIVIGADKDENGKLFVYDYANMLQWQQKAVISPQNTANVFIQSLGYTAMISSDGTRIISGAPNSVVRKNGKNYSVGCVLIYDLISSLWIQREPICPEPADDIHGFGHTLSTSSDCKYMATSTHFSDYDIEINNTGTVFISSEGIDGKWIKPAQLTSISQEIKADYGTDLHFLDASTVLVAVDNLNIGTLIYKRDIENKWIQKDLIPPVPKDNWPNGISNYGKHISMPLVDNSIIAITATQDSQKAGVTFILKKSGKKWDFISRLEYPEKASLEDIFFCGMEYIASPSSLNGNGLGAIHIFSKNDKNFTFSETISPSNTKMFGSSFTWNSRCNRFVVGAIGDEFSKGEVFIYSTIKGKSRNSRQQHQDTMEIAIVIASSVVILVLVIIVTIAVIFLVKRHKKRSTLQPLSIA